jgi:predicted DNA-binding transcriptional regulator AlpA
MNTALDNLPPELARHRILNTADAAKFYGVSLPQWRLLYRRKAVPAPIRLSERRYGWRVGDLIDALENRTKSAA